MSVPSALAAQLICTSANIYTHSLTSQNTDISNNTTSTSTSITSSSSSSILPSLSSVPHPALLLNELVPIAHSILTSSVASCTDRTALLSDLTSALDAIRMIPNYSSIKAL